MCPGDRASTGDPCTGAQSWGLFSVRWVRRLEGRPKSLGPGRVLSVGAWNNGESVLTPECGPRAPEGSSLRRPPAVNPQVGVMHTGLEGGD